MMNAGEQTPLLGDDGAVDGNGNGGAEHRGKTQERRNQEPNAVTLFRQAIGLPIPDLEGQNGKKSKPMGLYAQLLSTIHRRRISYHTVDVLYYIIIVTQLLLGAAIASLSSLSASHARAITYLGIINSFTAGVLALLKGQGLPDRLRKDEFGFIKVKDWIDAVEGRLLVLSHSDTYAEGIVDADTNGDGIAEGEDWVKSNGGVEGLVKTAWELWNTARDTSEINRPGSYAHQVDGPETVIGNGNLRNGTGGPGVKRFIGGSTGGDGASDGKGKGENSGAADYGGGQQQKGKGKLVID